MVFKLSKIFNSHNKLMISLLAFSFLLSFLFIGIVYQKFNSSTVSSMIERAPSKILERQEYLIGFLEHEINGITYVRQSEILENYLNDATQSNKESVERQFLAYSNAHKNIFQIRYIDKEGNEQIRVDRYLAGTTPRVNNILQNKSNASYFEQAKEMPFDEVFFTPIEPNREFGKIQLPVIETMRSIIPLSRTSDDGSKEFNGILIINYFMKDFLTTLGKTTLYDVVLYDHFGCIMYMTGNSTYNCYSNDKYYIEYIFPEDARDILEEKIISNERVITTDNNNIDNTANVSGGLHLLLLPKQSYIDRANVYLWEELSLSLVLLLALSSMLSYVLYKLFDSIIVDLNSVQKLNEELQSANKIIENNSRIDDLTGAYNRKSFNERIRESMSDYNRYKRNYCIAMFDIDHFKQINDTFGHDIGDMVLKQLSTLVKGQIRDNDLLFRVGGEEFVIIFKHFDEDECVNKCNNLIKLVSDEIQVRDTPITVSMGLTKFLSDDTVDSVYKRVDNYLYESKRSGRNKLTSCTSFDSTDKLWD